MKCIVQRVGALMVVGMILGAVRPGIGADRPPVSDEPWPTAEPARVDPERRARPITNTRDVSVANSKDRAPANPVVASSRPAAKRGAEPVRPVGSGVRPAAYSQAAGQTPAKKQAPSKNQTRRANGFVPLHEHTARLASHPSANDVFEEVQEEMIVDETDSGGPLYVPETEAEMFFEEEECENCGVCGPHDDCCLIPCPPWGSLQAWVGTNGFTGPLNVGGTASFGFQEGLNFGARLPFGLFPELGWQAGVRFTQTDLSGSELTDTTRNQTFFTAGLFRRVNQGLQFGVAVDLLKEDWYGTANLSQVRGELAWVYRGSTEYGIWWASAGRSETPTANVPLTPAVTSALNTNWTPTDIFAGYVRKYFGTCEHGQARMFFGASGSQDGIIGADAMLPMTDSWSFQAGFTYLIPEQSTGTGTNAGHAQESWNLGVSLVWIPGRPSDKNMYRPLMSVADNGSFLVDRR